MEEGQEFLIKKLSSEKGVNKVNVFLFFQLLVPLVVLLLQSECRVV